ncbi:MAG: hypothetical protein C0394_02915 [Syntrophus sp. (in: bacteria)]|nr:hypothetical protein [Syntrophus sp. (in: bacteria)]
MTGQDGFNTLFTSVQDRYDGTDDQLEIDFHYCPLVAGWQSHGATDEQIARLCDIAMQGDRGIAMSFGCELELGQTIAKGYSKCEIRFKRL